MGYKTVRRFFKYSAAFLSLFERVFLSRYSRKERTKPIVFIIGAPRSGSTILYQLITYAFDVTYINNLIDCAKENINIGFTFSQLLFKNRLHNSFQSDLGRTHMDGLNAPSEGSFWYKWLPNDHHYLTRNDLNDKDKFRIKSRLHSIICRYQKPLIIKNLSFSVRLDLIHELFPDARFIFISRNKLSMALSILNARHKNKIPKNKIWSIMPKNFEEIEKEKDEELLVIKQIYSIEKQIHDDIKLFPDEQKCFIQYEDLFNFTKETLKKIKVFIPAKSKVNANTFPTLERKEKKPAEKILQKLNQYISQFDWEDYHE